MWKMGKCMCRQKSQEREYWDFFVMFLACWNVIILPVEVAFEPEVKLNINI